MRITVVSTALPNAASGSGASIVLELLALSLRELGHDVSLCSVVYPEYTTPDGRDWQQQLEQARSLGIEIAPVLSDAWRPRAADRGLRRRAKRLWRPDTLDVYPTLADAPAVADAVAGLRPDAVLVYGFEALAASTGVRAPRLAATSDPPHLALWERARQRWRLERRPLAATREAAGLQAVIRSRRRLSLEMLRRCSAVGAFGHQHAEWLRRCGIACTDLRTPIADPGQGPTAATNDVPRILLVGHMQGVATLDGLRVFASMLSHLEASLGRNGFEARVVGGHEPPAAVATRLRHPAVRMLGHVDDIAAEFWQTDVLLVPVSIRLGVRVRILTGFAHSCCVVTHDANRAGIPELEHEANALLGSSPAALAQEVVRAVRDHELARRLRAAARETYKQQFAPAVASRPIAEMLERIATQRTEG